MTVSGILNAVERHLGIEKLAAPNAERISRLQQKLREAGLPETIIKKHMAHLKAALNWAKRQGMIHELPAIEMPRRAKPSKVMKGRPITAEAFERMLAKVPDVLFAREKRMPEGQRSGPVFTRFRSGTSDTGVSRPSRWAGSSRTSGKPPR